MTKLTWLKRHLALPLGLTAAVVLASCGQTGSPAATPTSAPTTTHGNQTAGQPTTGAPTTSPSAAPSQAEGKRIDITVKGKQVTPAPATINIAVGESLTIAVTADKDNLLHPHGFEQSLNLKAGQRGEITIKGAQTGVFEFELHNPALLLFKVAVR
jgi:uncharacterized cupredoxin-like copper-binding protein